MADSLERLSIYPLDAVLFPNAGLKVGVVDERHRQAVLESIEKGAPIGFVLVKRGLVSDLDVETHMVGTAAEIHQVRTYEDGRMDIDVLGQWRFRIRRLDLDGGFPSALVERLEESPMPNTAHNELLVQEVQAGFSEFFGELLNRPEREVGRLAPTEEDLSEESGAEFKVQIVFPREPSVLSFVLAHLLQADNSQKQLWLEITDTADRLESMLPVLQQHLDDIEEMQASYISIQPSRIVKVTSEDLREWTGPN